MKIKKKHTSGAARNYITRTQAVKKLQVSLADFRRLCIFKGIYPREPKNKKKANKGSTAPTTFYYTKDIQYLLHEPILQKFREHKAFAKKLSRALGRGEVGDAKRLNDNRPQYKLNHVIKERYPSFTDALRDLDDPLSMLFLFAVMPSTDTINHKITAECDKLCGQWMAYVAREGLLNKVFVSIKGVYYQAIVKGQPILWLVPFRFPQNVPRDVDFRIMGTFLEFYTTLVKFVLFRLYTEADLVYPPPINPNKEKGVGGITAYVLESKEKAAVAATAITPKETEVDEKTSSKLRFDEAAAADEKDQQQQDVDSEDEEETGELDEFNALPATETAASDVLPQPKKVESSLATIFSKFTFYIGREVPLDIIEFLIIACGGRIISEAALDELIDNENEKESNDPAKAAEKVDLSTVTHQICDRPAISHKVPGRSYVQPQWVFDSINAGKLLPVAEYAPGETLPPHLSPWGDAGGYDPEQPESDDDAEEEEVEEANSDGEESDIEEDGEQDDEHERELQQEAAGVTYSQAPKKDTKKDKKRTAADKEKEEKDLKKIMMSNKQRKLYEKMQYGLDKKKTREEELRKKRRKIDEINNKLKSK